MDNPLVTTTLPFNLIIREHAAAGQAILPRRDTTDCIIHRIRTLQFECLTEDIVCDHPGIIGKVCRQICKPQYIPLMHCKPLYLSDRDDQPLVRHFLARSEILDSKLRPIAIVFNMYRSLKLRLHARHQKRTQTRHKGDCMDYRLKPVSDKETATALPAIFFSHCRFPFFHFLALPALLFTAASSAFLAVGTGCSHHSIPLGWMPHHSISSIMRLASSTSPRSMEAR